MQRPSARSRISGGRGPRRARQVLAALVVCGLAAAATAGCAGRKGRNDDDPRPNEYSVRRHQQLLPDR